jgi:hypothetical protein
VLVRVFVRVHVRDNPSRELIHPSISQKRRTSSVRRKGLVLVFALEIQGNVSTAHQWG